MGDLNFDNIIIILLLTTNTTLYYSIVYLATIAFSQINS